MPQEAPYYSWLGMRVYRVPLLKLYFPFYISGSLTFFLVAYLHAKMMSHPTGKWENIVYG
ncbi:hypothetical protein SpCBS45565_g05809 [Spizellomyces sp. 'palustris']|nr:hypothetical protein SpCBS45565_g05809 [Spizellomyces sp. 'palustris']